MSPYPWNLPFATLLHFAIIDPMPVAHTSATAPDDLLAQHGLRATPARRSILKILLNETLPRSIEYLRNAAGGSIDKVTAYRTLEAFAAAGIARRVDLGHDHAHYELIPGRPHHHHAVCTDCGHIEDIVVPHPKHPEAAALAAASSFTSIDSYSFEFFGRCTTCS